MKTAYEIALERLEKATGPTRKLTNAQRSRIAELDKEYDARIAELKLSYDARFGSATSPEDLENFRKELAEKLAGLEARRDREKETVWNATPGH
jgi:hypothetical protein